MKRHITLPARRGALGGMLGEALALLLTAALSALLVALIVFAPQSFVDTGYNTGSR